MHTSVWKPPIKKVAIIELNLLNSLYGLVSEISVLFAIYYGRSLCWSSPGTYLETDFDRSVTRDVAIQSRSELPREMRRPEHDLSDMLRQPSRVDHVYPSSRQSHPQSAGHIGRNGPDKIPELTGGRYPAFQERTSQPTSRSPLSQRSQQWYQHGSY